MTSPARHDWLPGPAGRLPAAALTAIWLMLPVSDVLAGAWVRVPGSYYVKLEGAARSTDRAFDENGDRIDYASGLSRATYRGRQVRAYGEYGLLTRLTGIASLSYQSLEVEETAALFETRGFSDLRLGARAGLGQEAIVTAASLELKIPTGYEVADFPALGNGDVDVAVMLQAGRGFGWGYATVEAGINFRMGRLANEIPFSAEVGANPAPRTQIRAVIRGRRPMKKEEDESGGVVFDPTLVDSRNLDATGTIVYALSPVIDLEAGVASTFYGRNTLAGTELSLGLAWHR